MRMVMRRGNPFLLIIAFGGALLVSGAQADETVQPDPANSAEQPPLAVAVMDLQAQGWRAPAWLGRNLQQVLQKDVAELPDVYVSRKGNKGEFWPVPDFVLTGEYSQTPESLTMSCELVCVADQRVVARAQATGTAADLFAVREEIRRQVQEILAQLAGSTDGALAVRTPQGTAPATKASAALSPGTLPEEPVAGAQYDNSSLRWALENPEDFDRELDYWSRRSTVPARYGATSYAGPYGQLGGYPFVAYRNSYVLVPGPIKLMSGFQFPYTYPITQTPPKKDSSPRR